MPAAACGAVRTAVCAAVCALAATAAPAQTAGQILWKVGVNHVGPKVTSGDLSAPSEPGTKIDIHGANSILATVAYMVTDDFSVEAFAGLPYKHTVVGAGAIANVGKLGSIQQVSPTVLGQYRFAPVAQRWHPYAGLGLTYAYFFGEEGSATLTGLTNPGGPATHISAEPAWGVTAQLGTRFQLDTDWYVDACALKTSIKNTTRLSTGQSIDAKLDPVSLSFSVGRWF